MADLTSKYRKQELRDISMQACVTAIENGYKNFPENYYSGKFTDFLDIQGGTQPPKSKFVFEERKGFIRFLQIRDFSSESTPTYIPIDTKNKLCEKDDILLGRYGASVGKILTGKAGAYNVACAKVIILDKKTIDKDFLFFLLHSLTIQNAVQNISRSAQGGFNKGDLSKIKIVIPKIEWQKKLLDVLFGIDDFLINNSKLSFLQYKEDFLNYLTSLFQKRLGVIKEIEEFSKEIDFQQTHLQLLRQAILQEAVQGKLSKQNKDDEPADKLLQRIKAEKQKLITSGKLKKEKELPPITEDEIPFELPKGWVWCRLGEIIYDLKYGTSQKCDYKNAKHVVLRIPNVSKGRIELDDLKFANLPEDEFSNLKLELDDILVIRSNGSESLVGRTAVFKGADFECAYAGYLVRLKFDKQLIYSDYIHQVLESSYVRQLIEYPLRTTSGVKNINSTEISTLLIPLPTLSEQHRIVAKVQQLIQMVNQLEQQVEQSQTQALQLLQAVLKEAFSNKGKVYEESEVVTMVAEG